MIKHAKVHESAWIAHSADVIGNVELAEECSVWYNATIRADLSHVKIGKGSNIQDGAVVHVDTGHPCEIGAMVTVGHNAIVHGCTVGNNTVVGMGAILLNGCKVGKDCIIGAGALVTGKTVIPDGHMAFGNPAKVIRPLTEEEMKSNETNAMEYMFLKDVQ